MGTKTRGRVDKDALRARARRIREMNLAQTSGRPALPPVRIGQVEEYEVFVEGDDIVVKRGPDVVSRGHDNLGQLGAFVTKWTGRLRLALWKTEDFEIVHVQNPRRYGYAHNLNQPELSEWGEGPPPTSSASP